MRPGACKGAKEKPRRSGASSPMDSRPSELVGRRLPRHEIVEAALADAEPQDLFIAERTPRVVDLLEPRVLRRDLGPDLVGSVEARFHYRLRERHQLSARGRQLAQGLGILRVVLGDHPFLRHLAAGLDHDLVALWQGVPLFETDVDYWLRATLPPSRVVVVLRGLVESGLLVVVGTDPF